MLTLDAVSVGGDGVENRHLSRAVAALATVVFALSSLQNKIARLHVIKLIRYSSCQDCITGNIIHLVI